MSIRITPEAQREGAGGAPEIEPSPRKHRRPPVREKPGANCADVAPVCGVRAHRGCATDRGIISAMGRSARPARAVRTC